MAETAWSDTKSFRRSARRSDLPAALLAARRPRGPAAHAPAQPKRHHRTVFISDTHPGTRGCKAEMLADFLARNAVPYRWYSSDEPAGQRLLAAAGADGRNLPVLITVDGDALVQPSQGEVATRVGLSTIPERDFYDLIVIGAGPAGLSKRELEVARLVVAGRTNQQIAGQLFLSVRTVDGHLARLYTHLGVHSRTEAALIALQHHLTSIR